MFSKQDKILVFKLLGKHWSVLTTALSLPNSTDHDFFSACNCHNKHKTFLLVLYHLCHLSDQAKASSNLVLNTFIWCFEHIVSITKCFRVALNIALIHFYFRLWMYIIFLTATCNFAKHWLHYMCFHFMNFVQTICFASTSDS